MKIHIKDKIIPILLIAVLILRSCSLFTDESMVESESIGSEISSIDNSSDQTTSNSSATKSGSGTTSGETTVTSVSAGTGLSLFYVRDAWEKAETQSGAFVVYENAVRQADMTGQSVFDENGKLLYTSRILPTVTVTAVTPTLPPTTSSAVMPTESPPTVPVTPAPTPTTVPAIPTPSTVPPTATSAASGDYSQISNASEGWYYTPGSPGHSDVPATIDSRRAGLLAKYDAIWQLPAGGRKVVYLTMDEGYEYGNNTTEILNVAKDKNVKITFFVTGQYVESRPDLVLRMVNEGHQIANHTDKHLVQPDALDKSLAVLQRDIDDVNTKYKKLTGRNLAPYMRPPTGAWSERSLAVTRDMGYQAVFWSFAYRDWEVDNQPGYDAAYNTIMSQLFPGSVILIHAVSTTNTAILGRLIDGIRARGYTIELLP